MLMNNAVAQRRRGLFNGFSIAVRARVRDRTVRAAAVP
jgi:hypothetical protein